MLRYFPDALHTLRARAPRLTLVALLTLVTLLAPARLLPGLTGSPLFPDRVRQIVERDFLEVVTRNTPTTYYEGRRAPSGFEYELFRRFADTLDVSLAVDHQNHIGEVIERVGTAQADIGAAGLVLDRSRSDLVYSRPIMSMQPLLVYRRGLHPPQEIEDLVPLDVGTAIGNGTGRVLRELQKAHPALTWRESREIETTDLLAMIEREELDAAVIYAHEFKLSRLFFPGVEPGFPLGEPVSLAWAFPARGDPSLVQRANDFLAELRHSGELETLSRQYFGHDDYLEYVGARRFIEQIELHLGRWQDAFKRAAAKTGFDWTLLAAVGYQESHWQPDAVSPTGVKGLMMLTLDTASHMDIGDREDPYQSIDGGARYLRYLHDRIPEEVAEPDRTWMTLAAYNLGLGHLYDARRLASMRELDPDLWASVRTTLPLLQESRWYKRVEHGFARGSVAAQYVRNVRRYKEILNYVERNQRRFSTLEGASALHDARPAFETVPPVP